MKKILLLFIVGCLVLNGLGAVALHVSTDSQLLDYKTGTTSRSDELDQSQTVTTENATLPVGQIPIPENPINFQVAQSFIPTKEILTRVELFIGKNSTATHPYVVAIRDELTGVDLTLINTDPGQVPTEVFGWVEIDFDDIMVTTGQTYYIISYTENITDNFYGWGANNISESYPHGCAWISIDDGGTWSNKSTSSSPNGAEAWINSGGQTRDDPVTWDMCFKTYGIDNLSPEAPIIDGTANGKAGTSYDYDFTATDPDGDDVKYFIDWGDGNTEWTGFSASGTPVTVSHTWAEKDTYTITAMAQDEHGLEGPEGTLEVSMPKNYNINLLFLRFLEQHPHMLPILRYLLGL